MSPILDRQITIETAYLPAVRAKGRRRDWSHVQTVTPRQLDRLMGSDVTRQLIHGKTINTGLALLRRVRHAH